MKILSFLATVIGIGASVICTAADAAHEEPPLLVVINHNTKLDLGSLLDSANREFIQSRIAEIKGFIEKSDRKFTDQLRRELSAWEKGLSELKMTGKALPGCQYVTVFEEADCFVVAYFESSRQDQFVGSFSKKDYSVIPLSNAHQRAAKNATQKSIILN